MLLGQIQATFFFLAPTNDYASMGAACSQMFDNTLNM